MITTNYRQIADFLSTGYIYFKLREIIEFSFFIKLVHIIFCSSSIIFLAKCWHTLFYCMKPTLSPMESQKRSYEDIIKQKNPANPKILNLALLSNPFLKDQEHYRALHQ